MALIQKMCKICKDEKPWGRLDMHVKAIHKMTMEQYEEFDPDAPVVKEFEPTEPVAIGERVDRIFDGKTKKNSLDKPLKEFLEEVDLTEKDLRAIIHNYKEGKPLPLEQVQKFSEQKGADEARKLKDHVVVKTTNIHTAEALEKFHNFKCVSVIGAKGTIPKVWELEKQK